MFESLDHNQPWPVRSDPTNSSPYRDWHTLLEFCALVNSLMIDEDGIYDPRLINDRLLLGMNGMVT